MRPDVAVFTDTYLPTVNGVTYTIQAWRDRWVGRGGRMPVVYPRSAHDPAVDEYPVFSLPFPFYDGFRVGTPWIPKAVRDVDLVHSHTPFGIGLAGLALAKRRDLPFVASFHTPTSEYANYLSNSALASVISSVADGYETRVLRRADRVVTPSPSAKRRLRERGVDVPITVVPNGIDVERFSPGDGEAFRERHGLDLDGTVVGYIGRHGYEKRLQDVVTACERLDREVTVVFAGDGPARASLEARAEESPLDVRFLGFLERAEMPAFYTALDVFGHPSPVETEGLVALEANACGTPVVGVDAGGLADTVRDGETGVHYQPGDLDGFADGIERALADRERLHEACLVRRDETSVEHAVDRLESVYTEVLDGTTDRPSVETHHD
ncbi:glycosyltransferase [Halomarina oriensis]|uniref:Glycosyltransferase n=1 Tax=Halomarina oriensis TaxID=671145 RepID=A0A6B0GMG2_9EURY|nr:glycosyltransferase [Halomarina oriensis]MWG35840.1 glycosyltransferase [Halomarina oriensis]